MNFKRKVQRKIFHSLALLLLLLYYFLLNFGKQVALFSLLIILCGFLIYEYLRLDLGLKMPLQSIIKAQEKNQMVSAIYFIAGIILCLAVFDFLIAVVAVLMAVFFDVVVSLVRGSREILKKRTLEATGMGFLVSVVVGYLVLQNWLIILVMGVTAAVVGTITYKVEDNLAIPVVTGLVGQILVWILNISL